MKKKRLLLLKSNHVGSTIDKTFRPDKTKQQLDYFNKIKKDMELRKLNGDTDIHIKYVNGVPKIVSGSVSRQSKNYPFTTRTVEV